MSTATKMKSLADRATGSLAKVEAMLRQVDAADDQIGEHAETAHQKLTAEIRRRTKQIGAPVGGDPDQESEFLWMLGQRRRAADVGLAANHARQLRGRS